MGEHFGIIICVESINYIIHIYIYIKIEFVYFPVACIGVTKIPAKCILPFLILASNIK